MAQVGMTVTFGTALDMAGIKEGLANVQGMIQEKPFSLNIEKTGAGAFGPQFADAQAFFNEISQGTNNIEKLSVTMTEFRDKSGEVFSVPTQALEKLSGATNTTTDTVVKLNQAYIEGKKATDGWVTTGKVTKSTLDLGAATRQTEKDVNAMKIGFDNSAASVDKFIAKSENMSGKQVVAARNVALAIKDEKAQFDTYFAAGEWDKAAASGEKIKGLTTEFETLKSATAAGANVFQNWAERMGNALKQTISYGLSIQLVQKAQQALNDAIKYAIDLNTEMVKIQVLQVQGAQTADQINALADSYNKLGQAMAASTLDVARGSTEWLKQGKTIAETETLLKSTLMLSKIAFMDTADATNYLTAITQVFKISTEDTAKVVDKLVAVSNISATTAGELATALRYTSESAQIAGVSLNQLVSYIGTVSAVTRQNAEMVGQAFKTMFARMTQITGGGVDETGITISKVEKALHNANIEARNADGTFRDMGGVLEETASKWSTLTQRQQTEIAIAVGGVRQKEMFLVLMNNMGKALQMQAAETDSAGLAQQRYGIYLESVEAKQAKLTAAMQALYQTTINSDMVKWFLDAAINVTQFVTAMGGIPPLLGEIIGLMIIFNRESITKIILSGVIALKDFVIGLYNTTLGLKQATVAQDLLSFSSAQGVTVERLNAIETNGAAIANNGLATAEYGAATAAGVLNTALGILGLVAMAVMAGIQIYNKVVDDIKKKNEDAADAVNKLNEAITGLPDKIKGAETLVQEINDLMDKQKSAAKLSADETNRLSDAFVELYKIAPSLDWHFIDGKPILDAKVAVDNLKQAIIEMNTVSLLNNQQLATDMAAKEKQYADDAKAIQDQIDKTNILGEAQTRFGEGGEKGKAAIEAYINEINNQAKATGKALTEGQSQAINFLTQKLPLLPEEYGKSLADEIVTGMGDRFSKEQSNGDLVRSYATLISNLKTLNTEFANNFLKQLKDAATGPEASQLIKDAFAMVEEKPTAGVTRGEREAALGQQRLAAAQAAEAKRLDDIKTANTLYNQQINLIDTITTGVLGIQKIDTKTAEGKIELNKQVGAFVDKINSLKIDGLTVSLDDFWNKSTQAFDIGLIQKWANENIKNKGLLQQLTDIFPDLATGITQAADDGIAAMQGLSGATIEGFNLTASQAQQVESWITNSFYNLAKDANGTMLITLTNGAKLAIYSANQIGEAVAGGYVTWTSIISQATDYATRHGIQLGEVLGKILTGITSGKPFNMPGPITLPSGGGRGESPRAKEIDNEVKALNKQKNALNEQLKAYKEYITLQKESLQRQKDEAAFQDELANKHKALGRLKAQIALLSMDDSEAAQKQRLALEDQAATQETDITKLTADRKYTLQVQALDDLQKKYEDSINAQIKGIDDTIAKLNDEKSALQANAGGVGSIGSAWGNTTQAVTGYGTVTKQTFDDIAKQYMPHAKEDLTNVKDTIGDAGDNWAAVRDRTIEATTRAENYLTTLQKITAEQLKQGGGSGGGRPAGVMHQGGLVESHHGGEFTGNLATNEVFAKLLRGEYVATEPQMKNFLTNIFPKMALGISPAIKTSSSINKEGNINFDVKINVAGSLDKTVIPELRESFMKDINKALQYTGIRRTSSDFSV